MVKKVGSKDEVWAGVALHTAGKLTRSDLMLNASGKVVSRKQHANGKRQAGALKSANRTRASAVHPSHAAGHAAGRFARGQTGEGFFGNLLGSILPF